jgi:hypothetical protein
VLTFDPSFNVGAIVNILMLFGVLFSFYTRTSKTLAIFEVNYVNAMQRLDKMDQELAKLTEVAQTIALQKERISNLDKRIESFQDKIDKLLSHDSVTSISKKRRQAS